MKNFIRIITITTVIVLSLTPHAMFAQGWLLSGANTTLSPAGNKVGIGITPLAKLDVNGKIMTRHRLTLAQGNGSDPTTTKVWNLDNTNNDLRFFQEPNIATTGIVRMIIKDNGSVGIGTTTPDTKLHVAGGDIKCSAGGGFVSLHPNDGNIEIASANNQESYIDFKGYNNLNQDYRARISSNDDAGLGFFTNGSFPNTQMFITNAGKVGIGSDNPAAKLEVNLHQGQPWGASDLAMRVVAPDRDFSLDLNTRVVQAGIVGYDFNTNVLGSGQLAMSITSQGNVGIGTGNPQYKLDICGNMRAKEVRVETGWCDYVFDKNYSLRPLAEVEAYIKENHHLPNIPSATTIETEGLEVASMLAKHMEKIEELTLYIIAQDKQLEQLKTRISQLEKQ